MRPVRVVAPALLAVVAVLAASCSDDAEDATPTTTGTTTSTASTTTADAETTTTSSTSTTTAAPVAPADRAGEVAVTLRNGSIWDGELVTDNAVTYVGHHIGGEGNTGRFDFDGVAGPSSNLARMTAPRVTAGDEWPIGASGELARRFIDDVLPAFVDDEELTEPLPFGGADELFISDVLVSGTVIGVTWEVVEHDDDHVRIRADQEFDHRTVQRGAEAILVGTVTGDFTVDRRNPLAADGRVDVRFELTDSAGATRPVHQWWEATPLTAGDPEQWSPPSPGVERLADILRAPPADPDVFDAAVGYGGRSWDGRVSIAQTWTQLDREREPTSVTSELALTSALTAEGQWLRISVDEWSAAGPPFTGVDRAETGPDFALVIDPRGNVGSARLRDTDELETRTQRDWFGRVFMTALPALPLEPISVGATWQTREQDGTGPIYTVTALDPRHLELEASGDFGAYIGDRYDGYTVEATIEGTLRIDRQAAVPVDVDITMTGTITFAEAGELDPATTEPWESTFTLTAVQAPDAE